MKDLAKRFEKNMLDQSKFIISEMKDFMLQKKDL